VTVAEGALPTATHIDGLPAVVLDADARLLDDVQVGAGDGQRCVVNAVNHLVCSSSCSCVIYKITAVNLLTNMHAIGVKDLLKVSSSSET